MRVCMYVYMYECMLIAGTNTSGVGSWRQIWARDVAFLHFSQTASLRSHNGPGNVDEPHFFGALFPHCEAEGRRFGKNEEMRHLGPKCASRNHPKTGWFLRSNCPCSDHEFDREHRVRHPGTTAQHFFSKAHKQEHGPLEWGTTGQGKRVTTARQHAWARGLGRRRASHCRHRPPPRKVAAQARARRR